MNSKTFSNFFVNTFLFGIVLLCLVGILSTDAKAQTGNIKIDKIICANRAAIGVNNTCPDRIRDQDGKVFQFSVTAVANSAPPPVGQIDVTIDKNGGGSSGDTIQAGFPAGEFIVCELATATFTAIARPSGSTGGATQFSVPGMENCIRVITSGSGSKVLKFFNVPKEPGTTAATATVSGRIRDANGKVASRVSVTVTNVASGEVFGTRTDLFGRYSFTDLPTGQDYLLRVFSGRRVFKENERFINLLEDLTSVDFSTNSGRH